MDFRDAQKWFRVPGSRLAMSRIKKQQPGETLGGEGGSPGCWKISAVFSNSQARLGPPSESYKHAACQPEFRYKQILTDATFSYMQCGQAVSPTFRSGIRVRKLGVRGIAAGNSASFLRGSVLEPPANSVDVGEWLCEWVDARAGQMDGPRSDKCARTVEPLHFRNERSFRNFDREGVGDRSLNVRAGN